MELTQLEDAFVDIGGHFLTSSFDLRERMNNIKAIVFDWDGVFNDGHKQKDNSSTYSVVDGLGVNMLRFGYFLAQKQMLHTAVITGEQNPICREWTEGEHFDQLYFKSKDKPLAFQHFCDTHGLKHEEVIYVYDDILDLPVAEKAGIRLAVGRLANPLLLEYIEQNHLADYISSCQGHEHAVREFCELLLAILNQHFTVIKHRSEFSSDFQDFTARKEMLTTQVFDASGDNIERVS